MTLALTTSGTGTGTVTLNPSGGSYLPGTVVTLTANPNSNSYFVGWSGGGLSGSTSPTTITMPSTPTTVNAQFDLKLTLSITTSGTGTGTVSLNPAGGSYAPGTVVTLTANPASGSGFVGWSGGGLTGYTSPTTLTMPSTPTTVNAKFNLKLTETLYPSEHGSGSSELLGLTGASHNWQAVSDNSGNDGTAYVSSISTSYVRDSYQTADPSSAVQKIESVSIYIRCSRSSGSGTPSAQTLIRTHSTDYTGDTINPGNSWLSSSATVYTNNPNTNQPWTRQEVIDLESGVRLMSSGRVARCTLVWVVVEYTPLS